MSDPFLAPLTEARVRAVFRECAQLSSPGALNTFAEAARRMATTGISADQRFTAVGETLRAG